MSDQAMSRTGLGMSIPVLIDDWGNSHFCWQLESTRCRGWLNSFSWALRGRRAFVFGAMVLGESSFKITVPLSCIS